jgi:hypothetical protein
MGRLLAAQTWTLWTTILSTTAPTPQQFDSFCGFVAHFGCGKFF